MCRQIEDGNRTMGPEDGVGRAPLQAYGYYVELGATNLTSLPFALVPGLETLLSRLAHFYLPTPL